MEEQKNREAEGDDNRETEKKQRETEKEQTERQRNKETEQRDRTQKKIKRNVDACRI